VLKAALIGLGKMGLSHQSIVNSHPDVDLRAVCDTSSYVLDLLAKYTGIKTYTDYVTMLAEEALDCVFIATPSRYHVQIATAALDRGLHVFCEKPFGLDAEAGYRLADRAEQRGLVNQVGYHYRFVATFAEVKRLLERRLIGNLHHLQVEAYGPVVLRAKGATWRSHKEEGGGCLFDYTCHAIDLVDYLVGRPRAVSGTVLNSVFSNDVEDEIYSTLHFAEGFQGQLATNWSDVTQRKMSIRVCLWGTNGRINVDRQEIQVYLREAPERPESFKQGWNVRNTTELTPPVWFYVRGEEYSAQVDQFVHCVKHGTPPVSTFRSASDANLVAAMLRQDARRSHTLVARAGADAQSIAGAPHQRSFVRALFDRITSPGQA
jgi:scyllo-inositol 2-dehydrogenase (NADP+)